jgi:putative addiction module killer protein
MEQGNLTNTKSLGGIFEYKLTYGPGYRVYFGRDGDVLILLLGGGTKKTQSKDILSAKQCWADYKKRKKAIKES